MQLSTPNWIIYYKLVVCKPAMHKIWNLYRNLAFFFILLRYAIGNDVMHVMEDTYWQMRQKSNIFQQNTLAAVSARPQCLLRHVLLTNVNTNSNIMQSLMISFTWQNFISVTFYVDIKELTVMEWTNFSIFYLFFVAADPVPCSLAACRPPIISALYTFDARDAVAIALCWHLMLHKNTQIGMSIISTCVTQPASGWCWRFIGRPRRPTSSQWYRFTQL